MDGHFGARFGCAAGGKEGFRPRAKKPGETRDLLGLNQKRDE